MQYIVTVFVTQTRTCLGGLNGLPVVTRAFGSRDRGESGVLPGRDLSTFVAGRTLTNLQHSAKSSTSLFPAVKGSINLRFQMEVYLSVHISQNINCTSKTIAHYITSCSMVTIRHYTEHFKKPIKISLANWSFDSGVDVDANLLGYGTASLGSYSLRQHCALPHIQWSEFLDILTFEDQDTMSPQNTGISLTSDTMSYPRIIESMELILLCQLGY